MQGKILIIEDEDTILRVVRDYLQAAGYTVACAKDGLEGVQLFETFQPNLLILDINLPSMNGLEIATHIRKRSDVHIIMLTARGEENDQIIGLQAGADDYVSKPFSPRTLVARVDAAMRRLQKNVVNQQRIEFEQLYIDTQSREVWAADTEVNLTFTEFNLLVELVQHYGQVLSRQQLLDRVWGTTYAGNDRVVDVYVGQVRRKLEDAMGMPLIQTVRGAGYKFIGRRKE